MSFHPNSKRYLIRVPFAFCDPKQIHASLLVSDRAIHLTGKYEIWKDGLEVVEAGATIPAEIIDIKIPLPQDASITDDVKTTCGEAGVKITLKKEEKNVPVSVISFDHYSGDMELGPFSANDALLRSQ